MPVIAEGGTAPTVSVIVPAYDSARTIARCMACLGAQETRHPFEVILVHSGRDDTCPVARRVLPTVRVLELPEPAIPARARNVGVGVARGGVLGFVDSDVYVGLDWVDRAVAAAECGYDLVCGSIRNANPGSPVSRAEQLLMFSEFLPDAPRGPAWFALSGNTVMTRATYERFGPFAETRAAEDVVFSRRLLAAGGRILFEPRLRVAHDNRTRLAAFLRNQLLLGKHTAIARRLVPFADTSSYALFVCLVPVAPLAKLAKLLGRLARRSPRTVRDLAREFPLVALGILAYSAGMVRGVVSRTSL